MKKQDKQERIRKLWTGKLNGDLSFTLSLLFTDSDAGLGKIVLSLAIWLATGISKKFLSFYFQN